MVGRRGLAAAAALLLAACRDDAGGVDRVTAESAPDDTDAPPTTCVDRYQGMVRSTGLLTDLAPDLIADSCTVCGSEVTYAQMRTQPTRAAADALVHACGGCSPSARDRFLARFDVMEPTSNAPWRQLAADCPTIMGTTAATARFASLNWFWLTQLARALPPDLAPADLPLPAWGVTGAGFALPEVGGPHQRGAPYHLTVTPRDVFVGALPRMQIVAGASHLEVTDGDYPGAAVGLGELAARLAQIDVGFIAVITPRELPVGRLREVLRELPPAVNGRVVLAVEGSNDSGGPQTLGVTFVAEPRPGDVVIDVAERARGRWPATAPRDRLCRLPGDGPWPARSGDITVLTRGQKRLALAFADTTSTTELAGVLDFLASASIHEVALVHGGPGVTPPPPCPPTP